MGIFEEQKRKIEKLWDSSQSINNDTSDLTIQKQIPKLTSNNRRNKKIYTTITKDLFLDATKSIPFYIKGNGNAFKYFSGQYIFYKQHVILIFNPR